MRPNPHPKMGQGCVVWWRQLSKLSSPYWGHAVKVSEVTRFDEQSGRSVQNLRLKMAPYYSVVPFGTVAALQAKEFRPSQSIVR